MKIEIKNVTKKFKKNTILEGLNLTLKGGNIYGFVGRNGSGKTVLLKMICGFYEPTSGEILIDGENVIKNRTYPKNTSALIEKPCFLPELSGLENLELLAAIQNKIGKKQIIETLKKVNLEKEMNKKYYSYSLGMKQKLGIAQALMENPEIIILDEPFNGIENKTAEELRNLLLELAKNGKLIIVATHILDDINKMANIVYEVDDCKVELLENIANKN